MEELHANLEKQEKRLLDVEVSEETMGGEKEDAVEREVLVADNGPNLLRQGIILFQKTFVILTFLLALLSSGSNRSFGRTKFADKTWSFSQ